MLHNFYFQKQSEQLQSLLSQFKEKESFYTEIYFYASEDYSPSH